MTSYAMLYGLMGLMLLIAIAISCRRFSKPVFRNF